MSSRVVLSVQTYFSRQHENSDLSGFSFQHWIKETFNTKGGHDGAMIFQQHWLAFSAQSMEQERHCVNGEDEAKFRQPSQLNYLSWNVLL